MGAPKKRLIIENIESVLGTISTDNGYKTDVSEVSDKIYTWDEVPMSRRPFVGYFAQSRDVESLPAGYQRCTMKVIVYAHSYATTDAGRLEAISDLQDDIKAALMADQTRGNGASMTNFDSDTDDVADPSYEIEDGKMSCTTTMEFTIVWVESRSVS